MIRTNLRWQSRKTAPYFQSGDHCIHLGKHSLRLLCLSVTNLVSNIADKSSKFMLTKRLLEKSEPLVFSVEIHRWIRAREKDDPDVISSEQQLAFGNIVAARIKQAGLSKTTYFLTNI